MKLDPFLDKATRLIRRKKYVQAQDLLIPEATRFRGSFRYYYLLGLSFLYSRNAKDARFYFELANKQKSGDPGVMLGFAALYLQRGDTAQAVDYYLDILEKDPKNSTARRAMAAIKKYAGKNRLADWLDSASFPLVFPPRPRLPLSARSVTLTAVCCAAALLIAVYGVLLGRGVVTPPWVGPPERSAPGAALEKEDRGSPVQTGGAYRYILTREAVLKDYEAALKLFGDYRDGPARVLLNRILESNAAEGIKNKARLVEGLMEAPGFDSFKTQDNYSYADVMADPALYRGCYVIWRGMATNVQAANGSTMFDFLVGYDTKKNLEGIVPVSFAQAVNLNSEQPLELLGKVVPVPGTQGMDIKLEGLAIHQKIGGMIQ